MQDMNGVQLIGRLTRDVELRQAGQSQVCNSSIAVNNRVKVSGEWQEVASFIDITLFGRTAEILQEYACKGSQIAIKGWLKQETWEGDGGKRSKLVVMVDHLQLLGGKGGGKRQDSQGDYSPPPAEEDSPF